VVDGLPEVPEAELPPDVKKLWNSNDQGSTCRRPERNGGPWMTIVTSVVLVVITPLDQMNLQPPAPLVTLVNNVDFPFMTTSYSTLVALAAR